jgi:C-terminal processing protease CtpA/Prc
MVPYILTESDQPDYLKKSISWKGKKKTYKMPKPSKSVFSGQIYVLVNGRTYSAGSTLARYLKEFSNATFIGEETGTRYEGFAAGSQQYITLPNSGLRIGIPRYHIFFPQSTKQQTSNRGLLPDYQVEYTIQDRINDMDVVMKTLNSLIETE